MKSLDDYLTEKLAALKNSNDPIETAVCEDDYRLGAKACLAHLMERAEPFDYTEVRDYAINERTRSPHDANNFADGADWQHDQLSAKLAARDLEIEELRKINAENARAHTQSARDQILLGQGFVRVKYVPLEEIYKDEAHTGGGE